MIKEHMFNLVVRSDQSTLYDSKMYVDLTVILSILLLKSYYKKIAYNWIYFQYLYFITLRVNKVFLIK